LWEYRGGERADVRVDVGGRRFDGSGGGDGVEQRRLFVCLLVGDGCGRGGGGGAVEYGVAVDQRDGAGGADADGVDGFVVGYGADQLCVSVAAL
jgi:hypothetical protein